MQTKYDIGEKVYVVGEVIGIEVKESGTYYNIRVYTEKTHHDIVLKEDDEDLVKIPSLKIPS